MDHSRHGVSQAVPPAPAGFAPLTIDVPLGDLVLQRTGAARVLHRLDLDFCCGGNRSLRVACAARGLEAGEVLAAIEAASGPSEVVDRWDLRSTEELVDYVLDRFHAGHRAELPRLLQMAHKVEKVHRGHAQAPTGLAAHLEFLAGELELHMQKEEQVLFPMLLREARPLPRGPLEVMEDEHQEHGRNLARMRALAGGYLPPPEACATWRALYAALEEFEAEVMRHVHLENHVLFPRGRAVARD